MKYAGYALWQTPDATTERDLLRCCHCQRQWFITPGSGNQRGWCTLCAQPTCGAPPCQSCVPFARKLEQLERHQKLLNCLEE